ncbi:sensor histidine kinase, partial [Candidatus Bipolaricaulota bacterium]|nr:sensor histidine kinase [Candidatus Bipolaricaulota bacterium]
MEDLSLHILDIMENSVDAQARRIEVRIDEDPDRDLLTLEIIDDGKGMDAETLEKAMNPFFSTRKTRRFGLGLSMISESAKATGGELTVESSPGKGTRVRATFLRNHIDMKPLGDIPQTLLTLIAGRPGIE